MSVLEHNSRPARVAVVALLLAGLLAACDEESPLGVASGPLPGEPVTVEVLIPWDEFASDLQVFGGFGSPEDLGVDFVANQFADTLDARTLMRFSGFPGAVTVRDSTGTARPDSSVTFKTGRLVAFFDQLASTNTGAVTLSLGRLQQEWDPTTATWEAAIDTINDRRAWVEPGGGPVVELGTAVWDPAESDSVVFPVDSATLAAWADTTDLTTGARLSLNDPGSRLQLSGAALRLDGTSTLDPDTVVVLSTLTRTTTFIYSPFPEPPPDGVRIGGAPAWRTVLDVDIPDQLNGPPELCAVVSCPHTVEPGQISFAALRLTSRPSVPAFQPTDTVRLDVRPVLDRTVLPKSPLGPSLVGTALGRAVDPAAFGGNPGLLIEVPFTTFARDLARGVDEDGNPAPNTLALLSLLEPFSIAFASFEGPGSLNEPTLRLVLTIGPPVELP